MKAAQKAAISGLEARPARRKVWFSTTNPSAVCLYCADGEKRPSLFRLDLFFKPFFILTGTIHNSQVKVTSLTACPCVRSSVHLQNTGSLKSISLSRKC